MGRAARIRAGFGIAVFVGTLVAFALVSTPASAAKPLVKAKIVNATGQRVGEVTFKGKGTTASRVEVELVLPPGAPGLGAYHGLHIHTIGVCTAPAFTSAGGHWNPTAVSHGGHAGDLPSVLVSTAGTGYAEFVTHRFDVSSLLDADGSAVVLHAGIDNFGNVPLAADRYQDPTNWYNAATGTGNTGDAGGRYGCGVVKRA